LSMLLNITGAKDGDGIWRAFSTAWNVEVTPALTTTRHELQFE